jgi:hypothetical protein
MKKKYYIIDIKTKEVLGRYRGDYYFEDVEDVSVKYDFRDNKEEIETFLEDAYNESEVLEGRILEIKEVYLQL